MSDRPQQTSTQALMREMGVSEQNIERRKRFVNLTPEDLARIATIKPFVLTDVEQYTAAFFDYLTAIEESRDLLANRDVEARARRMKQAHLAAMVQGDYGMAYVEQRLELGLLYSQAGLDVRLFLGAFHHLLRQIGMTIFAHFEGRSQAGFEHFMSLKKIAFFDLGLIVDVIVGERERIIRQQQLSIRELSTPVLQLRDRLLLLPIIGVIDTHRARLLTEGLLRAIRGNRARVVVMDVTGVATIDSKVANHLLQTVAAARLMGATVIVTGLSSDVAQSLVALGIDLGRINTVGDLQGGIEEAERLLGYRIIAKDDAADAQSA